jgi:tetratricopeptide (TPR) repeat protein/GTPase SAR1 family protein
VSDRGPTNPYVAGPAITNDYGFYGRLDLIEAVVNTLTTTLQNAIVLHGQRRIGKSSLLHRLRRDEILRQEYLPIFFDLQTQDGYPPGRILANLAQTIVMELKLTIAWPSEADLAVNHSQFQRVFLPEVYRHLGHKRLLFLFDEFDVVVPPDVDDFVSIQTLLGHVLQTLIENEPKKLAFVFVVGRRLDLLAEGYQRLFKGTVAKPVGRLGQKETDALLTELGKQGGIHYTSKALAEIWALTDGHPYLTQLIGLVIFERLRNQKTRQVSVADVEACLDPAMEKGEAALNWYWSGFNPEQQWVLSAVADLTDRQKSISDAEISETLKQNKLKVTDSTLADSYQKLSDCDYMDEIPDTPGEYRFAIEFFRRWIVKYHPIQEASRRMEEFSPEARSHYQLGSGAAEKGEHEEAINHFRQALEHNDKFIAAYKALARALRATSNIQSAIDVLERAYQKDHANVARDLIEGRLDYARQLEAGGDDEAALNQANRILAIDSHHPETRQFVTEIFLRRTGRYLDSGDLNGALDSVRNLDESLPIKEDAGIGQRVRDLWIQHTRKLVEQGRLDEALGVLGSLDRFGLLDETVRTEHNQIILNKSCASLQQGNLNQALATLQKELKPPPPAELKRLLLDHSSQLVNQQQWPAAEETLAGLRVLVDDKDTKNALLDLYRQWVYALLDAGLYDEAVKIAGRGEALE